MIPFSKKQLNDTIALLSSYFKAQNRQVSGSLFPEAVTGLSKELAISLAREIVKNGRDVATLLVDYSLLSSNYLSGIEAILRHSTMKM